MPKPQVQLTGEDGNVFLIIGRTARALERAGMDKEAREYKTKALAAKSYDEVLRLTMTYAEVS